MSKTRVLVVDDSVVVRRLLTEVIADDPALELAGTAANGRIALAKIPQVNPDVVTLDLEMPEMDGLQTLLALRTAYPRLPVVMLSRFTQRGAAATLDALALGAADYVPMPDQPMGRTEVVNALREQLLPRLKFFGVRASAGDRTGATPGVPVRSRPLSEAGLRVRQRVDLVAIGASTGGPNALTQLLPVLPASFPVPVVVVQHMPPVFTRHLADRLASRAALGIREGIEGGLLEPGQAWLAPGDYHMSLTRKAAEVRLKLDQGPEENSCRPAVDVLFRSAAEVYGPGVLAVVLTGMGKDGLRGCTAIREAGGQVLVQDEASSVVWGMPGFVARADLAHAVLPLEQLGVEIVRRVGLSRSASATGLKPWGQTP